MASVAFVENEEVSLWCDMRDMNVASISVICFAMDDGGVLGNI